MPGGPDTPPTMQVPRVPPPKSGDGNSGDGNSGDRNSGDRYSPLDFPPGPRRGRLILVATLCALTVLGGGVYAVFAPADGDGQPSPPPVTPTVTGQHYEASAPPQAPAAEPPGDADLVASDDFTGTAPEPSRWGIYHSTGSSWSPNMVRVADGTLRIVGVGRNPTGRGNVSGGLCWCGAGGDRLYGKWQVRARFDAGAGYGPIIGLWPQSDDQRDGSIIFPDARESDRHRLHAVVVWDHSGQRLSEGSTLAGDFATWHTYTVEWREAFVTVYVDDRPVYDSSSGPAGAVIPRVPMHLYLQQTVGPREGVSTPNASTPDEVTMYVDWVRIYR